MLDSSSAITIVSWDGACNAKVSAKLWRIEMDRSSVVLIHYWVGRLNEGDVRARAELIRYADERLGRLTHRMLKDYNRVARWEDSDDVRQNASIRLWKALETVSPRDAADFFRLAALQVRRELIDLARRYFGPEGIGAHHASDPENGPSSSAPGHLHDLPDSTNEPERIASWAEFHQLVGALPDDLRETFELLWYQGLTQTEAAEVTGVSGPTIKRRWREARVRLATALDREPPG